VARSAPVLAGLIPHMNHPAYVIHWGVIQITLANLIVILLMLAVFAAALLLPFPKGRRDR
jgi:hypothetical protein